ncbi:MAG: hypothetical protein JSS15_08500 [Proteobacteria bacterium]|nr:hypothetical protein [Pseudomonadota bacterium]
MTMQDPDVFDAIARRGRSALAWEVLRRNPAYQAAYASITVVPAAGTAADPAFTADWGLHFP